MTAASSPPRPIFRVGLIGAGIAKSLTPGMHMEEGRRQGFQYDYQLIDTAGQPEEVSFLSDLLEQAEAAGFSGLNITHPFKQKVVALLDEVSPDVAALGACNTILFRGGNRYGHNTDWTGFYRSFRNGLPDASLARVVQLGAGGAGAATAYAMLVMGADHIDIFDVEAGRAHDLAERLNGLEWGSRVRVGTDLPAALSEATGVVQATAVGMEKYPGTPFDPALLFPRQWLAEVIYFPARTALLDQAAAMGCRTLSGEGMAVFQAVAAFELFTERAADATAMHRHFDSLAAMA